MTLAGLLRKWLVATPKGSKRELTSIRVGN